ncbi:MAG: TadE family protein [Candidatus Dormibacteria bacterium]
MVEFALIAPLFFALVIGLFSVTTYVFEVQIANDSAQAAARWGVAAVNFTGSSVPPCPSATDPSGPYSTMLATAQRAAGPLAGSIQYGKTLINNVAPPPEGGSSSPTPGCQITVSVPFVGFGGFFGPRQITATAIDYVT